MILVWQQIAEINKIRARIAEVSGVDTYPDAILLVKDDDLGEADVWFATKENTFVHLAHHGDSVEEMESIDPAHWGAGPHNLGDYQWPLDD